MEKETKEEVAGGVAGGVALFTLVALLAFGLSPLIHFWNEWNDYWNPDTFTTAIVHIRCLFPDRTPTTTPPVDSAAFDPIKRH